MSQFSDSRQNPGTPQDQLLLSIFAPPESQPKQHVSVSNLTKNLMSRPQLLHDAPQQHHHAAPSDQLQRNPNPPLYSASISSSHGRFLPGESVGSNFPGSLPDPASASTASSFSQTQANFFSNNGGSLYTPTNGNMNYIPLGHNTPTVVLTSYTSNYSYTPSFHSASGPNDQTTAQFQPGFLSSSYKAAPGNPTTNVSMDSANPNLSVHTPSSLYRNSVALGPALFKNTDHFAHLLPNNSFGARTMQPPPMARMTSDNLVRSSTETHSQQAQNQNQLNQNSQHQNQNQPQNRSGPDSINIPGQGNTQNFYQGSYGSQGLAPQDTQGSIGLSQMNHVNQGQPFLPTEPDHYMTYKEYLEILNKRDANVLSEDTGYEEHLNIVDYPVNELITMLACLLTKIIEANDKLHPNHFENTIAIRQKLKEQKKIRRMQRQQESGEDDDMNTVTSQDDANDVASSDDEEDELKNRYLANVLAFHGTNIPGISLHAYLTRVLKYCPVTNEVFLSLLVYFDRIAKKANNLRKKKKDDEEDNDDTEQLFVMDSYNIHRLIILGITVSSKFFSDIFYKNLRYAKVGGLPLEELNYLELQFLLLLDFKLMISVEDLQNYGDLLLKFWKREQLANELVNGTKNNDAPPIPGM
ncbi:CIC11C00000005352 [Sungouiella intermedia]|uniref:CIC11C00000005352 n=1 Tax=Sungouiella intermedia TaxID=45354 RepID=A0A1L0DDQ4_9ASCO|nr:CIC11C00000005352 [[Candida] intermedia]